MYLRQIKRPQGIYLAIQEGYYDSTTKKNHTRIVQSLGYLDALKKEYDDPIAFFSQKAKEMTAQKKQEKSACLTINTAEKMDVSTDDIRNVGYCVLKQLYKSLEIDKFWNWKTRNLSIKI